MAALCIKFSAWRFSWRLFVLSLVTSSVHTQCQDGTYEHGKRTCCLCGIGYHLEQHCTSVPADRTCTPCREGETYMSQPNDLTSCDSCTSCSHENDNLEEDEPCLPSRDRKCRCKKDHYCVSWTNSKSCMLCQPCAQCGSEGVKTECTNSSDTVCNDKRQGTNLGIVVGILVAVIAILAAAAVGFWFIRKRKLRQQTTRHPSGEDPADALSQAMIDLKDVDLQPHLPDIAELIGWNDMKNAAMRGKIPETSIENCALNHPNDHSEQALELLGVFVQHHGSEAPNKILRILQDMGKKAKAEKLKVMLRAV
ncbi:uncharacterized protein V6R79_003827 [Siganus canaliculatus]